MVFILNCPQLVYKASYLVYIRYSDSKKLLILQENKRDAQPQPNLRSS